MSRKPAPHDSYPDPARYYARMRRGCATAKDMTPEVVEDIGNRAKALAGTGQHVMLAPIEVEHLIEILTDSQRELADARKRLRKIARDMYGE